MDLRRRLAELDRLTRRPADGSATDRDSGRSPTPRADPVAAGEALACLELTCEATPHGSVWYRECRDPIGELPGRLPDLSGLFSRQADLRPSVTEVLLLDTETTGLAGGTGTVPFLTGVSWWDGTTLVTRQYFLPGPGREVPLLRELSGLARRFRALITYNGASFDLPLLRTRSLLNRCPFPFAELANWDLLVPARRLWGECLEDCRQQTLESCVCRLTRGSGDIDGARIPQTWFDFLHDGAHEDLVRVFTHNRRDMRGMAEILLRVLTAAHVLTSDPGAAAEGDWREAWALGRVAERRRDQNLAVLWMTAAAERARPDPAAWRERRFVADAVRILKRSRDWPLVDRVIAAGLQRVPAEIWLHREAAILCEHRLACPERALRHARLAGDTHREARLLRRRNAGIAKTGRSRR